MLHQKDIAKLQSQQTAKHRKKVKCQAETESTLSLYTEDWGVSRVEKKRAPLLGKAKKKMRRKRTDGGAGEGRKRRRKKTMEEGKSKRGRKGKTCHRLSIHKCRTYL